MEAKNAKQLFFDGNALYQDEEYEEAIPLLEASAKGGYEMAQFRLGFCYYYGQGVSKNEAKAAEWYRKAAEQEYDEAQYELGNCYYLGKGVEEDNAKAVEWYLKAAEQGNDEAMMALASCYEDGYGVPRDIEEATEWYRKAAEEGNEEAQEWLDEFGSNTTPQKVPATAQQKSAQSAEDIFRQAVALYKAGQQDKAIALYRKSADMGYEQAKRALDVILNGAPQFTTYGATIPQTPSVQNAAPPQQQAAPQKAAGKSVQDIYNEAVALSKAGQYEKAAELYRKAADQGDVDAQYNLAVYYKNGKGVSQDHAKATEWFRKAAEQGDAEAQNMLGNSYLNGAGVKQDNSKAAEWWRKAATQGHAKAQEKLEALKREGKI